MRALALLPLLLVLLPAQSKAICIASSNLCPCVWPEAVLDATITQIEGPKATLRIDAVHGAESGHAVGDEIVLAREPEDAVGGRTLVPWTQNGIGRHLPVDANGMVTCTEAEPDFRIEVSRVIPMMLSEACNEQVTDAGFQHPPCNDTGFGCGLGATTALALLPLLFGLRRRR